MVGGLLSRLFCYFGSTVGNGSLCFSSGSGPWPAVGLSSVSGPG